MVVVRLPRGWRWTAVNRAPETVGALDCTREICRHLGRRIDWHALGQPLRRRGDLVDDPVHAWRWVAGVRVFADDHEFPGRCRDTAPRKRRGIVPSVGRVLLRNGFTFLERWTGDGDLLRGLRRCDSSNRRQHRANQQARGNSRPLIPPTRWPVGTLCTWAPPC